MSSHIFGVAAIVVGVIIGAGAMIIARRTAESREQAIARQKIIQYVDLVVVAAILLFDAVDTPRHRWLDAIFLIIMACGVAFDWGRGRRAKTS